MGILNEFEAFCHEHDILIHFVPNLTTRVRGYCYYDGQYYNVILNNKLCGYQLKTTTVHEITHIMNNHFHCSADQLFNCEKEANTIVRKIRYAWGG